MHDCGPTMNRLPRSADSMPRDQTLLAQKTPPPQYLRPVPESAVWPMPRARDDAAPGSTW